MDSPISLRQLRVFLEVAREASLSQVAKRLPMSKSSVSQSLTELESRLGTQLFDRRNGRLQLNEAGRRLLPLADDLLARSRELSRHFKQGPGEPLRVGVTESVAAHYLMPCLQRFQERFGRFPKVCIGNTDEMVHLLADYELDLAMVEGVVTDPDMDVSVWQEERMFVVAGIQHPLQGRKLSWEDLRKEVWILREPGSGSRLYFESHLREKLGHDLSVLVLNHHDTLLRAVAAGFGVSFVSEGVLHDPHFGEAIGVLQVPEEYVRRLAIILRRGKFETEEMRVWHTILNTRTDSESLQ